MVRKEDVRLICATKIEKQGPDILPAWSIKNQTKNKKLFSRHWTSDHKGQCDPQETGNKVSPQNTLAYCSEFPGFSAGRGKPVDFQSHLLNFTREYGSWKSSDIKAARFHRTELWERESCTELWRYSEGFPASIHKLLISTCINGNSPRMGKNHLN